MGGGGRIRIVRGGNMPPLPTSTLQYMGVDTEASGSGSIAGPFDDIGQQPFMEGDFNGSPSNEDVSLSAEEESSGDEDDQEEEKEFSEWRSGDADSRNISLEDFLAQLTAPADSSDEPELTSDIGSTS